MEILMVDKVEWDIQANSYEQSQLKPDSLDSLIEYPAQLSAIGDVTGKTILDMACGSGRKPYDWIKAGAREVFAFDITDKYQRPWGDDKSKPSNLHIFQCDLQKFYKHPLLHEREFDLITSLQASGYGPNPETIFKQVYDKLKQHGLFILTTAHPMRFAVERYESHAVGIAEAYHNKSPYVYKGTWNNSASSTAYPKTISESVNALISSGFSIEKIEEPFMSEILALKYPHKYEWMKKYFGIIIYKARKLR